MKSATPFLFYREGSDSVGTRQSRSPQKHPPFHPCPRNTQKFRGQMIGNNDLWIAAHAKAAGMTLVTNNEREFRRVRGLMVENWAA
jgi:hypothetical protein